MENFTNNNDNDDDDNDDDDNDDDDNDDDDNDDDDNDDDDIRSQDKVIKEQLYQDNMSDYEKQIVETIQQSITELEQQQNEQMEYETTLLSEYVNETKRRVDQFKDFLLNIKTVGSFDKEIREIYEIIQPIIDAYCGQYFEVYEFDEITYNKIFDTLSKIRNTHSGIIKLQQIIFKSQNI